MLPSGFPVIKTMNLFEQTSYVSGRDPVAVSIEDYLHHEATLGHGRLRLRDETEGVVVSFGEVTARAETYDIALVRIARSLLEDDRFKEPLMERLRGLM